MAGRSGHWDRPPSPRRPGRNRPQEDRHSGDHRHYGSSRRVSSRSRSSSPRRYRAEEARQFGDRRHRGSSRGVDSRSSSPGRYRHQDDRQFEDRRHHSISRGVAGRSSSPRRNRPQEDRHSGDHRHYGSSRRVSSRSRSSSPGRYRAEEARQSVDRRLDGSTRGVASRPSSPGRFRPQEGRQSVDRRHDGSTRGLASRSQSSSPGRFRPQEGRQSVDRRHDGSTRGLASRSQSSSPGRFRPQLGRQSGDCHHDGSSLVRDQDKGGHSPPRASQNTTRLSPVPERSSSPIFSPSLNVKSKRLQLGASSTDATSPPINASQRTDLSDSHNNSAITIEDDDEGFSCSNPESNTLGAPIDPKGKDDMNSSDDSDLDPEVFDVKRKGKKKRLITYDDFKTNMAKRKLASIGPAEVLEPPSKTSLKKSSCKSGNGSALENTKTGPVTRSSSNKRVNHKPTFRKKDDLKQEVQKKDEEISSLKKAALNRSLSSKTRDSPPSEMLPDSFFNGIEPPSKKDNCNRRTAPSFSPACPLPRKSKDLILQEVVRALCDSNLSEDVVKDIVYNDIANVEGIEWDDIAGLDHVKKHLQEIVVNPMVRPDIYHGLRAPEKGVLLFGPAGTGKTLLGKCVAAQGGGTFFNLSASSVTSRYVGDGEKRVKAIFEVARVLQPSIVFIDEIDCLLSSRSGKDNDSLSRIKTEILSAHDGVGSSVEDRVLLMGTTNLPHKLDTAARRRFTARLYIPLPEPKARKALICHALKKTKHSLSEQDVDNIVKQSEGYSGADITEVLRDSAKSVLRDLTTAQLKTIPVSDIRAVTVSDILDTLRKRKPSVSATDMTEVMQFDRKYGTQF